MMEEQKKNYVGAYQWYELSTRDGMLDNKVVIIVLESICPHGHVLYGFVLELSSLLEQFSYLQISLWLVNTLKKQQAMVITVQAITLR
jgi:ABC-type antimicrobial peptide transport system permease subunit